MQAHTHILSLESKQSRKQGAHPHGSQKAEKNIRFRGGVGCRIVLRNFKKTGGLPEKKSGNFISTCCLSFHALCWLVFQEVGTIFSRLIDNRAKKYQRIITQVAIKLELSSQLKVTGGP